MGTTKIFMKGKLAWILVAFNLFFALSLLLVFFNRNSNQMRGSGGFQNLPQSALQASGNNTFTGLNSFSATSTQATTTVSWLGVGTTTPQAQLAEASSGTTTLFIDSSAAAKGTCLVLKDSATASYTYCVSNGGALQCTTSNCR